MTHVALTDSETGTLVNALVCAAEEYEKIAKEAIEPRLSEQFRRQARECDRLIYKLENA